MLHPEEQPLLGLRVLRESPAPEPVSRADSDDHSRARGRHPLCGPVCVVASSQAHHSEGQEADSRRTESSQWTWPSYNSNLPSQLALLHRDISFLGVEWSSYKHSLL